MQECLVYYHQTLRQTLNIDTMKDLINKSAAERGQVRDSNETYKVLRSMSETIADDMAQMMCSGAIGGDMTGSQVIEMIKDQAGVEVSRSDLKEIVAGSAHYDNSALLNNIEK